MSDPRSRDDPADDLRVGGASDPVWIVRGPAFTFRFDGQEIDAHPGETIAGALLAAGHRQLRSTRIGGRPRGLFCAIGACFDCLVRVDGNRPVRACLTAAAPDMEVGPGNLDAEVGPRNFDTEVGPRNLDAEVGPGDLDAEVGREERGGRP